jgi:type II secretory pathway pseudopilin PulG
MALHRKGIHGPSERGFSLVEIAIALGVVSFALLSVMALLPVGIQTNHISTEETRATSLLTVLEADLRNSGYNASNNGTSYIFKFPTPYLYASATATTPAFNTAVLNGILGAGQTTGLTEAEALVPAATGVRYQVSVIYTKVPTAPSLSPVEARLIINWPCQAATATPANLVNLATGGGYVESYVTFPAP